jgi:hypothetical protein
MYFLSIVLRFIRTIFKIVMSKKLVLFYFYFFFLFISHSCSVHLSSSLESYANAQHFNFDIQNTKNFLSKFSLAFHIFVFK